MSQAHHRGERAARSRKAERERLVRLRKKAKLDKQAAAASRVTEPAPETEAR